MDIIKRKISAKLGDNIYLKIPLTQNIENIGLMTDIPVSDTRKTLSRFRRIGFFAGLTTNPDSIIERCSGGASLKLLKNGLVSSFYRFGDVVEYGSDSKLEVVRTYDEDSQYIEDFDVKRENYRNYLNESINGVDRVVKINGDEIVYTVDAKKDSTIGTPLQTTGIQYTDNPVEGVTIPQELDSNVTTTKVHYKAEGWNQTNTSNDPQIQEEYLLGIISEPEVESDVFIDRTTFSILDKHLKLSEIESLEHLTRYGNGFYNINRD